nr:MAG TPA: hypothetical protein [Caudoviricetes sp.]
MIIYGNPVGGALNAKTYQLECNNGTKEIMAVVVDEETLFNATANDVRTGKKFATNSGVVVGTKDIPAYRTTQGTVGIEPGQSFSILLKEYSRYDYTKLQCMIAKFNTTLDDSVSVDRVVIDDSSYLVNSTDVLSSVTKNEENKSIDLNMTNNTDDTYVIRFFTYRQEE